MVVAELTDAAQATLDPCCALGKVTSADSMVVAEPTDAGEATLWPPREGQKC